MPSESTTWGDLGSDDAAATLLSEVLDTVGADSAVQFADARLVEAEELRSYHRRDHDPDERVEHNIGIGVRVLIDGAWGFSSRPLGEAADVVRAARQAMVVARAGAGTGAPLRLPSREPSRGRYVTAVQVDPFGVPEAERAALLQSAIAAAGSHPSIASVPSGVNAKRQHRHYVDTEGSVQHQHLTETGAMLMAVAAKDGIVQRRSYPNTFHGNTVGAGWEFVLGLDLEANAARIGAEAVELLDAPVAPSGTADLIIGPQQVSLQIHESVGHALELDRIMGDERNFAGTSFVGLGDVGTLRYGSPAVTIVSDPTVPGTRGSFGFDDEGTPAARNLLIDRGLLNATLSTRESAARAGLSLTGAARSDGWGYLPVCFSTHVFLQPGDGGSQAELFERLGDGYYLDDNASWSIDNRRWNFQFGTEVAYEIRKGKRGRLLRNFSYGGITPRFWGSVEAVAGPEEMRVFGFPCGKGEPKQWGFLSHGAPPMLVRDVAIGVA